MAAVSFAGTTLQVDATIVAAGLQLAPEVLRAALHDGTVTSTCETGEGSDAGRTRVTFYSATRRMRLVVDANGVVLQRSAADFTRRPKQALQGALRSPAVPDRRLAALRFSQGDAASVTGANAVLFSKAAQSADGKPRPVSSACRDVDPAQKPSQKPV